MKETVIVTSYQREELLWLCLEAIRLEDPEIKIRVYSDRGYTSDDLKKTCEIWKAELVVRGKHECFGNSFNLIHAMISELKAGADIIHVIEEDTIVHGTYLAWARARLVANPKVFACVCGRLCETPNWYESPCVSWDAGYLLLALDHIHIRPDYLSQTTREGMQKVVDEMFPTSKYKRGGAEQDGFFLRVIDHHGWRTKFPDDPLCSHLGFWGYNRPGHERPTGVFVDRVEFCRRLLYNHSRRRELFGHRVADREWAGMRKGKP